MNDQHLQERRWTLATRVLTGELSTEEKTEWEMHLLDDAFRLQFETMRRNWDTFGTLPYGQINVAADWAAVSQKIHAQKPTRLSVTGTFLRYAAVITIGLAVSFFLGRKFGGTGDVDKAALMTVIEAPPGARTSVTLPDSSKVWLNANSRISFNASYGADNRRVVMEGEAFFDVVKSEVPFFIETPMYNISVLGTAFNVKAYADDMESSTTLVRGSLKVTRGNEEVTLKPNEKVVVLKTPHAGAQTLALEKNVDAALATAWKEGWLSVQSESLLELAKKIERLYDVKISFQDRELESYRYSGRIRQFSLEQVLKALSLTSPVDFTIQEKSVVLRENKTDKSKYKSVQAH
jgi:transmembrane sensor